LYKEDTSSAVIASFQTPIWLILPLKNQVELNFPIKEAAADVCTDVALLFVPFNTPSW